MQLLLAGIVIIIIALLFMLFSHSQSLQRFAVLEFLLILMAGLSVLFGLYKAENYAEQQYFSALSAYLRGVQDYARDVEVGTLEEAQMSWETIGNNLETILGDSLPDVEGEKYSYITMAVCRRFEEDSYAVNVYRQTGTGGLSREECLNYVQSCGSEAIRLGNAVCKKTDRDTGVMVYVGTGMISPDYVYVTEVSLAPLQVSMEQLGREYIFYAGIFLLAGTALLVLIIALQARPLRKLVKGVVRVAEGKEDWTFLEKEMGGFGLESNEIHSLKNGLRQIVSDMAMTNYMQYRVMQEYCRFAPKKIEKILGKNSILEVDVNDSAHLTGTLAFVAYPEHKIMGEQEYISRRNREYEQLGEKQKEYGGILLSDNSDFTTLQLLFREETKKALHFGIDIAMRWEKEQQKRFFVMLHRTAFVYGIAGNDEQSFTYLLSKEMKMLEKYVERFRSAGIRMVVTDSVFELVEKEVTSRYIGYLDSEGMVFKIYEILDACPSAERQKRMDTREKFGQALNLFYQGDYYLGRNLFTEVLKVSPNDEVAKWYLFLCEKCLNAEYGNSISGALFSD